jgi:hypothetical protein
MSKYQSLSARLAGHPGDEWRASFAEIEEVLGFPLPKAAQSRTWWANTGDKPHIRAWADHGWQAEMDQASGAVTFRRPVSEAALQGAPELEFVAIAPEPVSGEVELEGASIRSRARGWGIAAAIAVGAAIAAGAAALLIRRRGSNSGT